MKYSFVAAALAAPIVFAAPAKRQSTDIDVTVLQFALTLEHLENVFYKQALQKFSAADFAAAGYGANYYNNLKYISFDEQSHVEFLTSALSSAGASPVAACSYNFPYTDVNSFITLSSVLEGVGTSAYLGGAPLITSKAYLTAAGSILVTEALHTSLQRSAVNEIPFGTPYGTPLDPTSVYTLAAAFIKSCPSSNAPLPFKPYPALTLDTTAGTCEEPNCYPGQFEKRGGEWQSWSTYAAPPATSTYYASAPPATSTYHASMTTSAAAQSSAPASSGATKNMPALAPGATVKFTGASAIPAGSYLTFVYGLTVTSVAGQVSGSDISAAIPSMDGGQTYVFVTKSAAAGNMLDAGSILFGPAILEVAPAAPAIDFSEQ